MAATTELIDHVQVFCDGVAEMAHTHVYLQEEKEYGSIEETIARFYDCKEDDYVKLCPRMSRIESLEVLKGHYLFLCTFGHS